MDEGLLVLSFISSASPGYPEMKSSKFNLLFVDFYRMVIRIYFAYLEVVNYLSDKKLVLYG